MKKLLSLLSVLTISGTAIPTTIAANPYQKEETINSDINYQQINNLEKLNRNKRGFNDNRDEIEATGRYKDTLYASFRPALFREITSHRNSNLGNYNRYKELVRNRIFNGVWMDEGIHQHAGCCSNSDDAVDLFIKGMWNNWDRIMNDWNNNGGQTHRMRIVMKVNRNNGNVDFISSNVRTDERSY
ncbi:hypothetical protein [Spiroplasma sp. hyd1]|uniref:hypothetical protein n=1 Tax=Spiroplasma sp. hyd1 TaxID=1609976 RepID=UPI0018DDC4B9|nr:hypothetical protein [Spiroplasma sp. hyd1]MBH8623201.1 hypothetical protein [Spiroplasma sp. hyd1]